MVDKILDKYPMAKFPPDPDCPKCKGSGEHVRRGSHKVVGCQCLYFDPASINQKRAA